MLRLALRRGLLVLLGLALSTFSAHAQPASIPSHAPDATDDPNAPRIVTLGGTVTEIVYALGEGDHVVGVDASSLYPDAATETPSVGYFRRLPAEGVLSLNPTLILALDGTGPPAVLDQLRSTGVRVELISDTPTVEGAADKIHQIGDILDRQDRADMLVQTMQEDLADVRALLKDVSTRPRVLFIYARGSGSMNVSGRGTTAAAMIRLAGGENAITSFEGYKPMTPEAVVQAAPDVILMPERGLESVGGVDGLLDQAGIALTPAGEARRIVGMDDLLLLGFGPRLGVAVETLARSLHPNLPAPTTSAAQ